MKSIIKRLPLVQPLYRHHQKRQYERRFADNCYGCFRGIYETFEQAISSAPKTKSIGYDNSDLAQEYQYTAEWETTVQSYDYPVLFWLKPIFDMSSSNLNIFDFGGNVGIHFYSYEKYLNYPSHIKWMVCDLPEIVNSGKDLADKRQRSDLYFTSNFEEASGKDIFLASGSIQYVENLSMSISDLLEKPKYLFLNRLPLYEGEQFVTLQNGGKVFYPSYVFNQADFIASLTKIGYELIDIWKDWNDSCIIPFYPEKSLAFYYGIFFKLKS